jgi:hypothetical protein
MIALATHSMVLQHSLSFAEDGPRRREPDRSEAPVAQTRFAMCGGAVVVGFAEQRIEYAGTKCRGDLAAM